MATKINIRGKLVSRPGVYSEIKSGIKNPPLELSYGNVCIIDTGIGAGWGGGAGINGTLSNNENAIYSFKDIQSFRSFVKGGYWWLLAEPLFRPASNVDGVSTLFYIRAATTLNAEIAFTFTNGSMTVQTKDEGVNANGVLYSGKLVKGYACKLIPGVIDNTNYILQFYVGTYKGEDSQNGDVPYDNITEAQAEPLLLFESKEVSTVQNLIDWCLESYEFNQLFQLKSGYTATGNLLSGDVATYSAFTVASGGTETFTGANLDLALEQVKNLDNTFFLATDFGEDATSLNNTKIQIFCEEVAKYDKFVVVGGGYDKSKFKGADSSIEASNYFNSDKVIVVHGGVKKAARGVGFKVYDQLYKSAAILGRICGLEPQTPITLKTLGIDGEIHTLSETEQEQAIEEGVLYSYYDYELGNYVVGLGINTLQNNQYLVNEDGTSYSIAVKRIVSQLNKEIIYTAKRVFFGKNVGPNRNTITEQDIKAWLEGFLQSKTASSNQDNLILSFRDITVTVQEDNYFVTYGFIPNFEISKILFTGFILDK